MTIRVRGKIWKYPGFGGWPARPARLFKPGLWSGRPLSGWHFFTLGKRISSRIKTLMKGQLRGFGSIRVKARIGKTEWSTSIFPTKEGMYLLPVKTSVRHKEGIDDGDLVVVRFELS